MQRRDGFCVKLCWRAGLFASSFVGGSSGCTTHNGAFNGCYVGGGYCDQSNTCYRCNYITPTLCDAFDNDCCSSEFLSQCPGDPHGCNTVCIPGQYLSSGTCHDCPAGRYQFGDASCWGHSCRGVHRATSCDICPSGHTVSPDSRLCIADSCGAGQWRCGGLCSHTSSSGNTVIEMPGCNSCPAGRYQSSTSHTSTSCMVCPAGSTSSSGASSCYSAPSPPP
eukprot:COSAG01_NODE_9195_length_2523_cov_27.632990_1_plen_221_part_10